MHVDGLLVDCFSFIIKKKKEKKKKLPSHCQSQRVRRAGFVFISTVDWEQCVLVGRGHHGPVLEYEQLRALMCPVFMFSLGVVVVFMTHILRCVMYIECTMSLVQWRRLLTALCS